MSKRSSSKQQQQSHFPVITSAAVRRAAPGRGIQIVLLLHIHDVEKFSPPIKLPRISDSSYAFKKTL